MTQYTSAGSDDPFVMKLNNSGGFVWAPTMGSSGKEQGFTLALDGSGNVYAAGTYVETVEFVENVNLVGAGASKSEHNIIAPTQTQTQTQNSPEVILANNGATNTSLKNLRVEAPSSPQNNVWLLRIEDVKMEVDNVTFEGGFSPSVTAVDIVGVSSSDSFVKNSIIQNVGYGVTARSSSATFALNTFNNIINNAALILPPSKKGASGTTPDFGQAEDSSTAGKTFGTIFDDNVVLKGSPEETKAEANDWGIYTWDDLNERLKGTGAVDFLPLKPESGFLSAGLALYVYEFPGTDPVPGGVNVSSNPTSELLPGTGSGLYVFPILEGETTYTVTISAASYQPQDIEVNFAHGEFGVGEVSLVPISGGPASLSEVHVDFANYSAPWDGTPSNPYNRLRDALALTLAEGTITIDGATQKESEEGPLPLRIDQAIRLDATNGPIRIGVTGAKSVLGGAGAVKLDGASGGDAERALWMLCQGGEEFDGEGWFRLLAGEGLVTGSVAVGGDGLDVDGNGPSETVVEEDATEDDMAGKGESNGGGCFGGKSGEIFENVKRYLGDLFLLGLLSAVLVGWRRFGMRG